MKTPHLLSPRLALSVMALLGFAGCADPGMDTRTHYLNERTAPVRTAVDRRSSREPRVAPEPKLAPEPKPARRARPAPRVMRETPPAPAATPAPAAPAMPLLRPTAPTLRDRSGSTLPAFRSRPEMPPAPAQRPRATPAPGPAAVAGATGIAGTGDFVIRYVNGTITKVSVRKKTGSRALDRRSTDWIWAKFHVRPGATGESSLSLTWREDRDRPTPSFTSI